MHADRKLKTACLRSGARPYGVCVVAGCRPQRGLSSVHLYLTPHLPFGFAQGRLGLVNAVASRLQHFDVLEPVGVVGLDDYIGGDGVAGLDSI